MDNQTLKVKNSQYKDLSVLALMTLVLFALKAIWALLISSGPLVLDEIVYKLNADTIFALQKYGTAHYPPAYPLMLVPALFFKHWYEAMLVLNAFWSSLVVPAVWLLARTAGVRRPLLAAALAALLPMHAVYPNVLFSENLFVPFFVMAMALALRDGRRGSMEALTFGSVLGIAHLTKYLFLPAVPLLFGAWLYSRSKNKSEVPSESSLKRHYPALLVLLAYGLMIGIWLYYGRASGFGWGKLFGFGIPRIGPKTGNIHSFLIWAIAYTLYLILAWLPVWGVIAIWTSQLSNKSWRIQPEPRYWRFLVLALLLAGGYWLLAVQHSFGASYNYPVPQRLIGRYLMQLSPIMLVVGIWVLERIVENRAQIRPVRALLGAGVIAGFASLAWWVLFNKGIWSFSEWFANREPGTVDVIALVSPAVFLFALVMLLLLGVMICFRRNDIRFAVLPIVLLMLVSLGMDAKRMYARQEGLHFRELAAAGAQLNQPADTLYVYYEDHTLQQKYFKQRMLFWGMKQNQLSAEAVSPEKGIKLSSLSSPTLLLTSALFDIKPLREYIVNDKTYYVYRIDGLDPKVFRPGILTSGKGGK